MSDRRSFLRGVSAAGAGMAVAASAGAATRIDVLDGTAKAQLKLSSQEWLVPGGSFGEKLEKMERWGYDGIELGGGIAGKVEEYQKAFANSKIKLSAICAADGPYIVPDEGQRKRAMDNAKRLLDAAGQLGSTGVIMVPAFNGAKDQLVGSEARKLLIDMLKELGEHAGVEQGLVALDVHHHRLLGQGEPLRGLQHPVRAAGVVGPGHDHRHAEAQGRVVDAAVVGGQHHLAQERAAHGPLVHVPEHGPAQDVRQGLAREAGGRKARRDDPEAGRKRWHYR